ncbi:hypothetical protein TNCV_192621 [Trichonephila clavipes]|nr:hypothetical protein TNCV_192621 [Trichonephila clavipes]
MKEDRSTKKVFNAQPIRTQRKGRPNLRWINDLEKDILVLRTRNWRTLAERWLACLKKLLGKAEVHPGLLSRSGRKEHIFSQLMSPINSNSFSNCFKNFPLF